MRKYETLAQIKMKVDNIKIKSNSKSKLKADGNTVLYTHHQ